MTKGDLLHDAERVVALARRAGAEASEAFALASRSGGVRIEKDDVGGIESDASRGIGIRVLKGARVGFAYVTGLDQAPRGIEEALRASRLSTRLPRFSFAAPRKVPRVPGLRDPRVEAWTAPDALATALEVVRGVRDVDKKLHLTEGAVSFAASRSAIANSEGVSLEHAETNTGASCFVVQSERGVSTGFASRDAVGLGTDLTVVGPEAAKLALAARDAKPLPKGGPMTLVLRPEPASDLLGTLTIPSLYGKPARRNESYYSGRLGKRVTHPKLSLIDDATEPGGLGSSPFDDEGEPSRRLAPIRRGVLTSFLFDRQSGAEFRARSTGSAVRSHAFDGRSHKSPPNAGGRNMHLEGPSTRTQKLIAGVDDGLLVHDMMGVHTANTVSGDFSVTSSVLFRIRRGAVEGPVRPVSIAGNFHEVLKRGLLLGDDVKPMGGECSIAMPSVRCDDLAVTP